MDVPIEILGREVEAAAKAVRDARARIRRGEADDERNPLDRLRRASSKATWRELGEHARAGDPRGELAIAVRAWVHALTLDRVLWADEARLAAAWRAESIQIDDSDLARTTTSPRAALARMLGEADPRRRSLWARVVERGATAVSDAARLLAERRAEATRLLGADADALEIPCERSAIEGAASDLLARTSPLLTERFASFASAIAASLGRELGAGWPARLTRRWLEELVRPTGLADGLRLDLDPLPRPLGASSFARALASFGAALADADGPRAAPFALARPPFDLRRARRAALFGGLVADPCFGARALGLGRDRARDQARGVARALLLTLRLDAARVLLRGALLLPAGPRADLLEERTAVALGAPIPPALAGVVPRLGPDDPTRFAGALLAAVDRRSLVERFDEDWFRSPHAARAIREEDADLPASPRTSAEALARGCDEIVRALSDL